MPFPGRRAAGWESGAFPAPPSLPPPALRGPAQHPQPARAPQNHPKKRGQSRRHPQKREQGRGHLLQDVLNQKWDFGDLSCPHGATEDTFGRLSQHQAGARGSLEWGNLLGRGRKGTALLPSVRGQVPCLCQAFCRIWGLQWVRGPPSVNPPSP